MRNASVILIVAVALGACAFQPIKPNDPSPMQSLERAEASRAGESRMHPACRDDRVDRDDQGRGCRDVARRGR